MLKCSDIADQSSVYLDGSLPRGRRLAIWLHLMMCHHCRDYLKNLRTVIDTLAKRKQPTANKSEVDKIIARIKRDLD